MATNKDFIDFVNGDLLETLYFNIEKERQGRDRLYYAIEDIYSDGGFVDNQYKIYTDESGEKGLIIYHSSMFGDYGRSGDFAIYDSMITNSWIYVSSNVFANFLVNYGASNVYYQGSFSGKIDVYSKIYNIGSFNKYFKNYISTFDFNNLIVEKNIIMHPVDIDGNTNKQTNLYPKTKVSNLLTEKSQKFNMPNVFYQEKKVFFKATEFPSSGTEVKNLYLNTELPAEETIEKLKQILSINGESYASVCYFYYDGTYTSLEINSDYISENETGYLLRLQIGSGRSIILFSSHEPSSLPSGAVATFPGWVKYPSDYLSNPIEINTSISYNNNDIIKIASQLIGISPFEKVETSGGLFQTKEDGTADETKPIQTGISEERVNELIDLKITGWLGGES